MGTVDATRDGSLVNNGSDVGTVTSLSSPNGTLAIGSPTTTPTLDVADAVLGTAQRAAPTAGQTVTVTAAHAANKTVFIRPSGTLATLTVQVNDGVIDGQLLSVWIFKIITALTITGNVDQTGGAIGPASAAGAAFTLSWDATAGTWVVLNV